MLMQESQELSSTALSHEGVLIIPPIEQPDPWWHHFITPTLLTSQFQFPLLPRKPKNFVHLQTWRDSVSESYPEFVLSVWTFGYWVIIRLPKAGALALLQRTVARAQAEKIHSNNTQEEEEDAEEREKREVAVGAKLVRWQLEMTESVNGFLLLYFKGFSSL